MKYRQLVSNTTPVSVQIWLEDELERFGIDGAYTRYILSLLQQEPVTLDPSEIKEKVITDTTCIRNGTKNIFVPFSKARHRGWKNWNRKWQNLQFESGIGVFDLVGGGIGMKVNQAGGAEVKKGNEEDFSCESPEYTDSEELKKLAAVECLITASEEAPKNEVGEVIDKLCGFLKNWQADSESPKSLNMDPEPISTICNYLQLQNGVLGNRHDLYNADFPALNTNSKVNQLESIKDNGPKVWESVRNCPIVEDDSGKEDSQISDDESNSSEKENIVEGKRMPKYSLGDYNYSPIRLLSPPNNSAIPDSFGVSTLYHSPFNGSSSFSLFPQTPAVLKIPNQSAIVKNSDAKRELSVGKPGGYLYKHFGQFGSQDYKGWDKPNPDTKAEESDRDLLPLNLFRHSCSGGVDENYSELEEPVYANENHMFSQTHLVWAPADDEALKFKRFKALNENSEEKSSESSFCEDFSAARSQESDNSSELGSFHGSSIVDADDGSMENPPDSHSENGDDNEEDLYLDPVKIINKDENSFVTEDFVGVEDEIGSPLLTPKDLPPFQNAIKDSAMHNLWGKESFLGGINATNGVWSGSDKIAAFYEKNYARIEDSISQDVKVDTEKMFNHSEGSQFKKFDGALSGHLLHPDHHLISSCSKPSSILKKDDEEEENLLTSENSHFAPIHPDTEDSEPYNSDYVSVTEIKIKKNQGAAAAAKIIRKEQRKKSDDDLSAPLRVEDLEACSNDEDSGLEKVKILQAGFRSQTAVDRSNNTTPIPSRPVYLGFQLRTLEYGPRSTERGPKSIKSPPAVELRSVSYTVSGNNPCWEYASKLFKTAGLPTRNDTSNEDSDLLFGKPWSTSDGSDELSRLGAREISFDPLAYSDVDTIKDIDNSVANLEDDSIASEGENEKVGNNDDKEVRSDAVACAKLTENFEKLCSLKERVNPESSLYGKITAAIDNGWSVRTCDDETLACYEDLIGNNLELPAIPTNNALYSSELEDEWQRLSQPFDIQLPCKTKPNKFGDEWHSSLHQRPCSFYLEGNCHRFNCKFSHDLSRITCRFWEEGSCFKGLTCPFLHGYLSDQDFSPLPLSPFLEEKSKPLTSPVAPKWNFKLESEKDFPSLSASSLQDTDSQRQSSSTSDLIDAPKKLANSSRRESGFGRIIRSKKSKKCFSNHLPISTSSRNEVSFSSRGKNQDGVATKKNVSATIRHDFALKI